MLVLTRRRGEGLTIGPEVRIVVLGVKGGQVRLGIVAPPSVEVHRDEIFARIQEENRFAAMTQVIPVEAFMRLSPGGGRRTN